MFPVVVEVPTVGSIQPHIGRGPVTEVSYWVAGDTHTRSLIALVLFHDVEL